MVKTLSAKITATPMTRSKEPFAAVPLTTRDRAKDSDGTLIVPIMRHLSVDKGMDGIFSQKHKGNATRGFYGNFFS